MTQLENPKTTKLRRMLKTLRQENADLRRYTSSQSKVLVGEQERRMEAEKNLAAREAEVLALREALGNQLELDDDDNAEAVYRKSVETLANTTKAAQAARERIRGELIEAVIQGCRTHPGGPCEECSYAIQAMQAKRRAE